MKRVLLAGPLPRDALLPRPADAPRRLHRRAGRRRPRPSRTGLADRRLPRDRGRGRLGDRSAAAYTATPSGTVDHRVVDAFLADLSATLAGAGPLDAVYLSLHGAMVTDACDDVEGLLLARLRRQPGCEALPVFGVFDLHANFSPTMAELANGLVCYRENPHIDARESGVRAARLLARCLDEGRVPVMAQKAPGIIWAPSGTGTADLPMRRSKHWRGRSKPRTPTSGPSTSSPASPSRTLPAPASTSASSPRPTRRATKLSSTVSAPRLPSCATSAPSSR